MTRLQSGTPGGGEGVLGHHDTKLDTLLRRVKGMQYTPLWYPTILPAIRAN